MSPYSLPLLSSHPTHCAHHDQRDDEGQPARECALRREYRLRKRWVAEEFKCNPAIRPSFLAFFFRFPPFCHLFCTLLCLSGRCHTSWYKNLTDKIRKLLCFSCVIVASSSWPQRLTCLFMHPSGAPQIGPAGPYHHVMPPHHLPYHGEQVSNFHFIESEFQPIIFYHLNFQAPWSRLSIS